MKRLLQTSAMSVFLALIAVMVFTACTSHKTNKENQQSDHPVATNQLPDSKHKEFLLGKVINAQTGQAVAHAKVIVNRGGREDNTSNPATQAMVMTNRNGLFIVTGIAKGDHVMKVKANGFQFWKNTVYVPALNKTNAAGPFNGFFMPSKNNSGWLHGVFQVSNSNHSPSNLYDKSIFIIIGLQAKK